VISGVFGVSIIARVVEYDDQIEVVMRLETLLKILPAIAATLSLCAPSSSALGSHQPPPTPQPVASTTYLTPAYCNFDSSAAPDSTETWTTITTGSGPHAKNLLALLLHSDAAGFSNPFGLVTNAAHPTFSSLAFDVKGLNSALGQVDVVVANTDGFLDEGGQDMGNIETKAMSTTPTGYKHCVATPLNLNVDGGPPFDQLATFIYADLFIIGSHDGPAQNLTLVNVSLNGGTFATGVLATPANNCQEFPR
jgi:hypothetical protein